MLLLFYQLSCSLNQTQLWDKYFKHTILQLNYTNTSTITGDESSLNIMIFNCRLQRTTVTINSQMSNILVGYTTFTECYEQFFNIKVTLCIWSNVCILDITNSGESAISEEIHNFTIENSYFSNMNYAALNYLKSDFEAIQLNYVNFTSINTDTNYHFSITDKYYDAKFTSFTHSSSFCLFGVYPNDKVEKHHVTSHSLFENITYGAIFQGYKVVTSDSIFENIQGQILIGDIGTFTNCFFSDERNSRSYKGISKFRITFPNLNNQVCSYPPADSSKPLGGIQPTEMMFVKFNHRFKKQMI